MSAERLTTSTWPVNGFRQMPRSVLLDVMYGREPAWMFQMFVSWIVGRVVNTASAALELKTELTLLLEGIGGATQLQGRRVLVDVHPVE